MDDSLLPVTSLRENLNQAYLDFSYFRTTEPKLTPALRKMPFTDLRHTIWTGEACQPQAKIWCEIHETKKRESGKPFTTYRFLLFYNLLHAGFFHQPSLNNGNSLFITFMTFSLTAHVLLYLPFHEYHLIGCDLNIISPGKDSCRIQPPKNLPERDTPALLTD